MGRNDQRPPVITDPLRHAENKWHQSFTEAERVSIWEPFASYCTTKQFSQLDEGFVNHCGPVAVTNLLLTLNGRYGFLKEDAVCPEEIFREVCVIGRKDLAYWNTDALKLFGGTYDPLTGRYIRDCLRHFGAPYEDTAGGIFLGIGRAAREGALTEGSALKRKSTLSVSGFVGADLRKLTGELRRGKVLYLQLHWHPSYRHHHVVCYGCRILADPERKKQLLYLLAADGWAAAPRYVEASSMLLRHYYAIG